MKASATAKVLIEMRDLGSWGDGCTVEQIKKQAEDAVKARLSRTLQGPNAQVISTIDIKITLED